MAKASPKTAAKETEENSSGITPQQQMLSYLKANKEDHFNFEQDNSYQVPCSSLTLTSAMDGGIYCGGHRAVGITAGGKTSCTLDFMYHFLKRGNGHKAIYVKSEGRLAPEVKLRSGIAFTNNAAEWEDGICFVFESNVYEAVFGLLGDLIRNNPTNTKYFVIIDSLDMMAKRDDLAKPMEEAGQVAGGALITSVFLKKAAAALNKRGHFCWFISQLRESIKINMYAKETPRQGGASGGHAVEHAGDYVLEFLPRFNDDMIREDPANKNSKIIGHYCRLKIIKSNNEKYGVEVRYPIKYGRTGATSVWVEREIIDLLLSWEQIEKKGAWFNFIPALREEIKTNTGVEIPELMQGLNAVYKMLEDNKDVTSYLYNKLLKVVSSKA
jgi:RecA/RadA recombinase